MSKQTAVELLEQQLKERYSLMNSEPLFEQAKQMEKEQIEDAWLNGMKGEMIAPLAINNYRPEAEDYYNETYTKEK